MNGELAPHARHGKTAKSLTINCPGIWWGIMYNPENNDEWVINKLD